MIRINLLPPEDKVKRREFHLPEMSTVYLVIGVAVFLAATLGTGLVQKHRIRTLEKKIELAREESKKLAPQLAKIKQITKEREEVNKRLSIITSLDRHRYYRVKLLSDLSYKIPANCWITDLTEVSPNRFNIDGVAFNNYTIADMMTNLESSPVFSSIDLLKAEKGMVRDRDVMTFKLSTGVVPQ